MSQAGILNIGGETPGVLDSLTGNSGGAVGADASHNINLTAINTNTVIGTPGTNTLTIIPTTAGYPVTPFVVGPANQAGYQTVQSAVAAAGAAGGGIVVVQPGTYTENLTLINDVHIMGLTFADAGGGANIIGTHIPPSSGGFVFRNLSLTGTNAIFSSAVAGTAHLVIADTIINVTNGY